MARPKGKYESDEDYKKRCDKYNERHKQYYKENREKIRSQAQSHYKETKNSILENKKKYRLEHHEEILKKEHVYRNNEGFRIKSRLNAKQYRNNIKEKVFKILGDKCTYCGYDNKRFLEINHKNGKNGIHGEHGHAFWTQIALGRRKTDDLEMICKVCNTKYYLMLRGIIGFEVRWNPNKKEIYS
jgi:hypothetical protein